MKLETRIKNIVSLTVDDFFNNGRSTKESEETLIKWLSDDLMQIKDIEDLSVVEISLLVLQKINSLDIIDLEFIHNILLDELPTNQVELEQCSIFEEV
ncbi:hypothetical protein CRU96_03250 [Malaciobacter halophilus]|nr:hypothetical protein [Malaciobacter halophilus]RYA24277.1 hypothetical protein CRU96_03250 [Malaciobacter halophilus]